MSCPVVKKITFSSFDKIKIVSLYIKYINIYIIYMVDSTVLWRPKNEKNFFLAETLRKSSGTIHMRIEAFKKNFIKQISQVSDMPHFPM